MQVSFDLAKSELNRLERGFGFSYAAQIFKGRTLDYPARTVDGESRSKAIGKIEEFCYVVIYTERQGVRRIITARRANRKETDAWLTSH